MPKNPDLNGLIHKNYDSESEMAISMGWSRQRLNRITNGKKVPDLFEVKSIADALHTSFMDVAHIFLPSESPNVDSQ